MLSYDVPEVNTYACGCNSMAQLLHSCIAFSAEVLNDVAYCHYINRQFSNAMEISTNSGTSYSEACIPIFTTK